MEVNTAYAHNWCSFIGFCLRSQIAGAHDVAQSVC